MKKNDLAQDLGITLEQLETIIKSCGFNAVSNFNAVQINVIKSYIKKASKAKFESDKKEIIITDSNIEILELVTVPRKEIIELLSIAYHRGLEKGRIDPILCSKDILNELLEEAING